MRLFGDKARSLLLKELSEWEIDIDKLDEDALQLQLQQKNQQQESKFHTIYQIPIKEENQFL